MLRPRSFTREDVVELHCHGGAVTSRRALDACLAAGARLARAGEFTLRAFLNGRVDLTQAEAVAQLVTAKTAAAADCALAGLEGGVGGEVRAMRRECVDVLAELEARIDFEDDVGPVNVGAVAAGIARLQARVADALATARRGRLLSAGLQVAIVGRPNVGKSSLLNALCGAERAIVTTIAGTTRDVVDAQVEIRGMPVTLLDTAGIRSTHDEVEALGVERSRRAARTADILLFVYDAEVGWTADDGALFEALFSADDRVSGGGGGGGSGGGGTAAPGEGAALLVANKLDLVSEVRLGALPACCHRRFDAMLAVSAATRDRLADLEAAIERLAAGPSAGAGGGRGWAVNDRQADALVRAHESLRRVGESIAAGLPLDFWTVDLRDAQYALGDVTGDAATEEVLDTVFSRFCIGK